MPEGLGLLVWMQQFADSPETNQSTSFLVLDFEFAKPQLPRLHVVCICKCLLSDTEL